LRAARERSTFSPQPEDIRPALERVKMAIRNGKPALVNVVTDFAARAVTVRFTKTAT